MPKFPEASDLHLLSSDVIADLHPYEGRLLGSQPFSSFIFYRHILIYCYEFVLTSTVNSFIFLIISGFGMFSKLGFGMDVCFPFRIQKSWRYQFFSRSKYGGDVFYFSLLSTFAFDVCFFWQGVAMEVTGRGRKWSRSPRVEWNMYRVWGYIRRVAEIVPVSFLWWFIEMIVYYYFYSLLTYLSILCCWFHLLFCGIALGGLAYGL